MVFGHLQPLNDKNIWTYEDLKHKIFLSNLPNYRLDLLI